MSWLLPSALSLAAAAALGAIALHFISRRRPLAEPLPTVRFVPRRPVHARTRSYSFSDLVLLIVRVLAITALGIGVAGPLFAAAHGRVVRVVVADRSRAVADVREVADSARALLRDGDVLIAFDSAARVASGVRAADSLVRVSATGSLSAALVSATGAAGRASNDADSVDVIVISPFAGEEFDAATARIRATLPGRIRLVPVRAVAEPTAPTRVRLAGNADDPVVAGLSLMNASSSAAVRIVRARVTAADSAWARDSGHVLVHWPASDSAATWPRRATIDAIGGVASHGGVLVGRLPRVWTLSGNAVARWADGEPAAVERVTGSGCIRDVGVLIDPASDRTLHESFRNFAAPLLEPCGGAMRTARASAPTLAMLEGPRSLATSSALGDRTDDRSRWTPWLLALAALLLFVELPLRRARRQTA